MKSGASNLLGSYLVAKTKFILPLQMSGLIHIRKHIRLSKFRRLYSRFTLGEREQLTWIHNQCSRSSNTKSTKTT